MQRLLWCGPFFWRLPDAAWAEVSVGGRGNGCGRSTAEPSWAAGPLFWAAGAAGAHLYFLSGRVWQNAVFAVSLFQRIGGIALEYGAVFHWLFLRLFRKNIGRRAGQAMDGAGRDCFGFRACVAEEKKAEVRKLMTMIDGHCDTITTAYDKGVSMADGPLQVNFEKLQAAGPMAQCFAIWLAEPYRRQALLEWEKRYDFFLKELEGHPEKIRQVFCASDIENNTKNGLCSAILTMEGADALEGKPERLTYFHQKGVRILSFCWNEANALASGADVKQGGLTEAGKAMLQEMERLGILMDVSHLNDDSFWDVARLATRPFLATHSNSRKRTNVKRNLTDAQLKAIANAEGVVGLNLCPTFLSRKGTAQAEDVLDHLRHMLRVMGEDFIGLGCDFDGILATPLDLPGAEAYLTLYQKIKDAFGTRVAEKVTGENMLRLFEKVW